MLGRARKGILSKSLSQETDTLIFGHVASRAGRESVCVVLRHLVCADMSPQPLDVTDTVGV